MEQAFTQFFEKINQLYIQGDLSSIKAYLQESRETFAKEAPGSEILVLNEFGTFYHGIRQFNKALDIYEEAGRLLLAQGEKGLQYASVLNNMAGCYRQMNELNKAMELFAQARKIYEEMGMTEGYEYLSLLNNLALVHRQMGCNREAAEELTKAIVILEKLPDCQQEMAAAYNNLMALFFAMGEKDQAIFAMNRALHEFGKCPPEERIYYVTSLNSMGALLFSEGFYEQSLSMYKKSQKEIKNRFGENGEYGNVCMNMYWVYDAMDDRENAALMIGKACRLFEIYCGPDHEKTLMVKDLKNRY